MKSWSESKLRVKSTYSSSSSYVSSFLFVSWVSMGLQSCLMRLHSSNFECAQTHTNLITNHHRHHHHRELTAWNRIRKNYLKRTRLYTLKNRLEVERSMPVAMSLIRVCIKYIYFINILPVRCDIPVSEEKQAKYPSQFHRWRRFAIARHFVIIISISIIFIFIESLFSFCPKRQRTTAAKKKWQKQIRVLHILSCLHLSAMERGDKKYSLWTKWMCLHFNDFCSQSILAHKAQHTDTQTHTTKEARIHPLASRINSTVSLYWHRLWVVGCVCVSFVWYRYRQCASHSLPPSCSSGTLFETFDPENFIQQQRAMQRTTENMIWKQQRTSTPTQTPISKQTNKNSLCVLRVHTVCPMWTQRNHLKALSPVTHRQISGRYFTMNGRIIIIRNFPQTHSWWRRVAKMFLFLRSQHIRCTKMCVCVWLCVFYLPLYFLRADNALFHAFTFWIFCVGNKNVCRIGSTGETRKKRQRAQRINVFVFIFSVSHSLSLLLLRTDCSSSPHRWKDMEVYSQKQQNVFLFGFVCVNRENMWQRSLGFQRWENDEKRDKHCDDDDDDDDCCLSLDHAFI